MITVAVASVVRERKVIPKVFSVSTILSAELAVLKSLNEELQSKLTFLWPSWIENGSLFEADANAG
jgi:hypothetical protein